MQHSNNIQPECTRRPLGDHRDHFSALALPDKNVSEVAVQTSIGVIVGGVSPYTGLVEFKGIPYAAAPVGENRFRPPTARATFRDVFHADKFGYASAQVFDPKEGVVSEYETAGIGEPTFVGHEDSLTLNVWTPSCNNQSRPVLIYLHGGANWLESSRLSTYDGAWLAQRGDIVVVTLNYRLGIFGALDLSTLGCDAPPSAHANGVRDQLFAIDWVRSNVRAFGGDPDNITLVGESAGSMDISWMIAAGELNRRVKRVVMMSGVGSVVGFGHDHKESTHSIQEGRHRAKAFLDQLGVSSFRELQHMKMPEILERCARTSWSSDILFEMDTLYYPRSGDIFSKHDPFVAAHNGAANGLDIMIGYTGYELGLWLTWDQRLDQHSADWAAHTMPFLPNHLRSDLARLYSKTLPQCPEGVQGMHLLSDAMFGAPSVIFADAVARNNSKCWMYRFDYEGVDARRGALHAADMCFFLGTWDTPGGRGLLGESVDGEMYEQRQRLSLSMQDALIAFVRSGNPNTKELPHWPRFESGQQKFMSFNRESQVGNAPLGTRGEFWLDKIASPVLR